MEGLRPHLEEFMLEILEKIQVNFNLKNQEKTRAKKGPAPKRKKKWMPPPPKKP